MIIFPEFSRPDLMPEVSRLCAMLAPSRLESTPRFVATASRAWILAVAAAAATAEALGMAVGAPPDRVMFLENTGLPGAFIVYTAPGVRGCDGPAHPQVHAAEVKQVHGGDGLLWWETFGLGYFISLSFN